MCRSETLDLIFELVDMESSIKEKLKRTTDQRINVLLWTMLRRVQIELKQRRKQLKRKNTSQHEYSSSPKQSKYEVSDEMDYIITPPRPEDDDILGLNSFFARLDAIKSCS